MMQFSFLQARNTPQFHNNTIRAQNAGYDLQCLMLSANAGSGIAFFRKFSIDFSRAARCGKHCNATVATHHSTTQHSWQYTTRTV